MKKVLFIIDSLQTGGAEKSILEIAQKLKFIQPLVCVLYSDKDDLRDDFMKAGVEIIDLNINRKNKFWLLFGKLSFEKICKQQQPDIVHAHLFKSELIARISVLPKKTKLIGSFVSDTYSVERYKSQTFKRNLKLNFFLILDRLTINNNAYITSITQTIAENICKKLNYPTKKVIVIYRGRNINNYIECDYNFKKNSVFEFIIVGRLFESKGYSELIDAVNILKNFTKDSFKISIVGEGADELQFKNRIIKKKINSFFSFLGTRTDVPILLQKANCFVLPSHYEGQGGALVEAMLTGLPIICSDIAVFREQVQSDVSAKLFQLKSPEDLAMQMLWMMNHYAEAKLMGSEARKTALEKFDIDKIAQQTEAFYLKVIFS